MNKLIDITDSRDIVKGDRLVRITGDFRGMKKDNVGTVSFVNQNWGYVEFNEYIGTHDLNKFKLFVSVPSEVIVTKRPFTDLPLDEAVKQFKEDVKRYV